MTEIDLTKRAWGHNFEVHKWHDHDAWLWVWCTPGPQVDDTLILEGSNGPIYARVVISEKQINVDDMYFVCVVPASEPKQMDE